MVMLAQDTILDVPVALKLVPEVVLRDSEGIIDLKKEVLRGMELTHPNIVRVFSFEQDATAAVIVMEHVPGETLAHKKAQRPNRCFDVEEILPWVEQLCSALDYAHTEARIAHRDLKPSNLMLTSAGRLKVADFGIASSLSDTLSRVSVRADSSGTPPYMSPQQVKGERPTHLDDIYSFGATVYELLTGKPPFFRGNVLAQVMHEEPPSMTQRRAELGVTDCALIPSAWEKTIAACLSKHPDARPNSGAAVLAMLRGSQSLVPAHSVSVIPAQDAASTQDLRLFAPTIPQAPAVAALTPVKIVQRREIDLAPVAGLIGSFFRGIVDLIGTILRPIFILALIIAALWGAMFLKHQWDASQSKRDEAAARQAAAAAAASAAAAPAAAAPAPQVIYLPPPPPNALDRGPYRGDGSRPPPPPRH